MRDSCRKSRRGEFNAKSAMGMDTFRFSIRDHFATHVMCRRTQFHVFLNIIRMGWFIWQLNIITAGRDQ